jgi:hypothetical protein
MSLKVVAAGFFSGLLALSALGCAADAQSADDGDGDDTSAEEALTTRIEPGSFKLYSDANHKVNQGCDVFTSLVLKNGPAAATLEEHVGGFCEIAVVPNARTYRLKQTGTSCGSKIYSGSFRKQGKTHSIKITDHRTRLCEDVVPAAIIVEETVPGFPGPITTKKFSLDREAIEVTGKLVHTVGIGGENTGSSIASKQGMFELVLDAGERNQFVSGKTARVRGSKTTLSGVETHDRPAIIVDDMLVCPDPGFINCMPGPNVRLSNLCAGENHTWVTDNCPGVSFAF